MLWLITSVSSFLFSSWGIATCTAALGIYLYLTWNFKHWESMNVPFIPPTIIVGNEIDRVLFRKSFSEAQQDFYFRLDGHPVGGMFEGRTPFLMLRDPNVIKNVLVRDFECFVDRWTIPIRPKSVSESSLLFLKGSDWRAVRHASTPIFSSGKMKAMSLCVTDCTEQMLKYLENHHKGKEIEMKSFFGRFTLNVIASSAFGIQCDSLANPEAEFVKVMSSFGNMTIAQIIALLISIVMLGNSWLARVLNVRFINLEIEKYLSKVVLDTKKYREREREEARAKGATGRRVDFLQMMLDAQEGSLKVNMTDNMDQFDRDAQLQETTSNKSSATALTDNVVIGQSLIFLVAGFETSSTLLTFASYELALNPEIQERARAEVHEALSRHGGLCCYEALADMPYLENVLNETLRKHPPVARVERICNVTHYEVEGTNARLQNGDIVSICIRGLHYDPRYYPEPEKFDPDRFLPENKQKRSPYVFLPFGSGPRNCIGMRFAMMSSKMAIACLLNAYKLEPCARTEIPFKISKSNFFLTAANGIYLNLTKIE